MRVGDGLTVLSAADLERYANSAVRVELYRRHDPALGPNAVELATDLLGVFDRYNVTPDDLPPELNLGRVVLDALTAARARIDGPRLAEQPAERVEEREGAGE